MMALLALVSYPDGRAITDLNLHWLQVSAQGP
jgi:hypothetical protein